jgi:hypothetical protein
LADLLAKRHVPFMFLTGYGRRNLPSELNNIPMLQKPISPATIIHRLSALLTEPVRSSQSVPATTSLAGDI